MKAARIAGKLKCDIIHAVDLDTLWAAFTAAKENGAKVLYESRELYTELLALYGRPLVKLFWKMLERKLIHTADSVITINDSIADELAKRYSIEKPLVVMNVAGIATTDAIDLREEYGINREYTLIYQGILRPGQGIARSLRMIRDIPETELLLIGDGPYRSNIEMMAEKYGVCDRVKFAGMVPPERLLDYTAGGDAGFLLMEAQAMNNYLALPQKIFQYIEAGTPPIVTGIPELRKVVESDRLGLVLDYKNESGDSARLSEFLKSGLDKAKQNCKLIKGKYSWEKEGDKIINAYKRLVG